MNRKGKPMSKLSARRVSELHGALHRIESLDQSAISLANAIEEDAGDWGEKFRNIIGPNRLSQWRNCFLGQVVATAIINELMCERKELVGDIGGDVDCLDPPMIFQNPDRENR